MQNSVYCLQSPDKELYLTVLHPENDDSPVDFFAEPHLLTWDKNTHFEIIEKKDHILIKNGNNFLVNDGNKLKLSSSNSEASPFKSVVNDNVTTFINIESGKAFDVVVVNFDIILGLHQNLLANNTLGALPDFMKDMADLDTTKKYLIKFKNIDAVITPGQNATKKSPIRLFGTVEESNNCFNYSYFEFEKKTLGLKNSPVFCYYIKKAGTDLYMQWVTEKSDNPTIKNKAYQMILDENKQEYPGATGAHSDFLITKGSDGSYVIKNFYQYATLKNNIILNIDKEKKEQNAAVAKVDSVDEFEFIPIENVKVENFRSSFDPKSPNFKILVSVILILILVLVLIFCFIG